MSQVFPDAPIFTAAYLPNRTYPEFKSARVKRLPFGWLASSEDRLRDLMPLWVAGFAGLRLNGYDCVLSSTTWGAKFVSILAAERHACYCYAPNRLLWKPQSYGASSHPAGFLTPLVQHGQGVLRGLDRWVTRRASRVATTCRNMQRELGRCYGVPASVIYPPIRLPDYHVDGAAGDYYLCVSRLIYHKRVDLALLACQRLRRKLLIVGDGPERQRLMALADAGTTRFLGSVPDQELRRLYAGCRALVFPSDEDFGLAPLEAQASGRPVVALGTGGALETVQDGITGVFFAEQSPEAVIEAILRLERMQFDPHRVRESVERFGVESFREQLRGFVLGSPGPSAPVEQAVV